MRCRGADRLRTLNCTIAVSSQPAKARQPATAEGRHDIGLLDDPAQRAEIRSPVGQGGGADGDSETDPRAACERLEGGVQRTAQLLVQADEPIRREP